MKSAFHRHARDARDRVAVAADSACAAADGRDFRQGHRRVRRRAAGRHRHADRPVAAAAADGDDQRDRAPTSSRVSTSAPTRVKFELAGFKTVVNEDIRVTVGFSAQVNAQLGVSTVQETVTVTGESPIVDTKETGTKQTFTQRAAAEHPVGARPVGHPAADGRHRHGPREHRRQHVGPAVQLRVARRQPDQQQVVARRRRHHRHGGDRLLADLLRLRRVRGNDDQHRRRRRDAADRRRRHQPRDQERHRPVQGLGALLRHERHASSRNNITDEQRTAGRDARATRSRTSRTTASRSAARSRRARAWIWGSYGKQNVKRRRPRLLPADATCQAIKADAARATPIEDDQRLPEHRPDAARRRRTSRVKCSCSRATS